MSKESTIHSRFILPYTIEVWPPIFLTASPSIIIRIWVPSWERGRNSILVPIKVSDNRISFEGASLYHSCDIEGNIS